MPPRWVRVKIKRDAAPRDSANSEPRLLAQYGIPWSTMSETFMIRGKRAIFWRHRSSELPWKEKR